MKPSFICLKGCRQHNLKNMTLSLPKFQLIAITGVSGSGKSSLAFDTLFAEGQRRYLEYLSAGASIWIKQIAKPDVDSVEGLSPTLSVGQGRAALFAKGMVATYTDIYDFLALLYVNIGHQHSPTTGKRLIRYSRQEMINLILKEIPAGNKFQLLAPINSAIEGPLLAIARLEQSGFTRFKIRGQEWTSELPLPPIEELTPLEVVVDRLEMKENIRERLAGSLDTALEIGRGILKIQEGKEGASRYLTEIYVCPETSFAFAPLQPADFNFNSPQGACPVCHGLGSMPEINSSLLFENQNLTLSEQMNLLMKNIPKKTASPFLEIFYQFIKYEGIKKDTPLHSLSPKQMKFLLEGSPQLIESELSIDDRIEKVKTSWLGIIPFLNRLLQDKKRQGSLKEMEFVEWKRCSSCQGGKLKPESLACLIKDENIDQLCQLTASQLLEKIRGWEFSNKEKQIASEILPEIEKRLLFLEKVGLGYLQLNRQGRTLSGGEAQRIQLASQIGAKLSGLIYVLDEPSLGLHRQDVSHLLKTIQELVEIGNSVVMVEHERHLIRGADQIVEIGPGAGKQGGRLTFQGSYAEMTADENCLTGQWMSGKKTFSKPPHRKPKGEWLEVKKASLHNLHQFSVKIPLGSLVGFCGVSGSGKSTLGIDLIGRSLQHYLAGGQKPAFLSGFEGIKRIIVGRKLIDRFSARSIPATYVNLMGPLRDLYAETRLAKARGYKASRFSLNVRGGRCEACEGKGEIRINMQMMADLFLPCEVCRGLRYNPETLQVTWESRNIADVLSLSVDEAVKVFRYIPSLSFTLELMQELGLGYLTLGQPSHTLSGGEIQRLRLVSDLLTKSSEPTLYILDEPSAGLHFEDIEKLLIILHRLIEAGHSIIMIEHHLDLLMQADWLIELGPGGGPNGGKLIFEGTPKKLAASLTPTGKALKELISSE